MIHANGVPNDKKPVVAVLESGEIKAGKMTGVTRLGERLVFWKTTNNEIVCLKDKCAHRGASLAVGKHWRYDRLPFSRLSV